MRRFLDALRTQANGVFQQRGTPCPSPIRLGRDRHSGSDAGWLRSFSQASGHHRSQRLSAQTAAPNKSDPFKVAFSHEIQLFLARHHFPVPHLIATSDDNNTLVQTEEAVYEVFEFLQSTPYDRSAEATASAGRTLALSHKILAQCHPKFPPPTGGYHDHPQIPKLLRRAEAVVGASLGHASGWTVFEESFSLRDRVRRAANAAGLRTWPKQIVHADYHPGNVLFHGHHVVGVIDFDGARIQQCIVDLANSVTTFSTFIDSSVRRPTGRSRSSCRGLERSSTRTMRQSSFRRPRWKFCRFSWPKRF